MNHELAKKLKDAGFPQCEEESQISCHANGCWKAGNTYGYDDAHNPTLSELIEACNQIGHFHMLESIYAGYVATGCTTGSPEERKNFITECYETPEEAVANLCLWLKLNEKLD